MKLTYKGCLKNLEQLPKGNLPKNAVKFREPNTPTMANIVMVLYLVPALLTIKVIVLIVLKTNNNVDMKFNLLGAFFALLVCIPHEFLHAICFPSKAEVQMYFVPKSLMLTVTCTEPITKLNYIWMSLCPNLFLGWIPLIIWSLLPGIPIISGLLYSYSLISIVMGCGDYMNIANASIQMPHKSFQQLSGFNSYWFKDKLL